MKYRNLGDTGIIVSEVGFGTWGLGGDAYGQTDDAESKRALNAAFDSGINFYDTADFYGNGHSEDLLGEVFCKNREKVIITTKGGMLPHKTFEMIQDFSSEHINRALTRSLQRLKTDYVDIYLLHSPKIQDLENYALLETLDEMKKSGLVRAYGISARTPAEALCAVQKYGFKIVEINFNLIDQRAKDDGLFELAKKQALGLIIRTPLTFGFLTGKLRGDEKFENTDHRSNWPKSQLKRWAEAHQMFSFLFKDNRTPVQAALRFCLDHEVVSTVIPGMMNTKEVAENVSASELARLAVSEMNQIELIYRENDFYDKTAKMGNEKL